MRATVLLCVLCAILGCSGTTQATELDVFKFDAMSQRVSAAGDGGDGRIRGVRDRNDKDFVFGGLFPIHSDAPDSSGARCGEVRQERGLERMEAMLFALDKITADTSLLPGLQLGYDIRDTCNSETIGLDEAIDLIIIGSDLNIESCESAAASVNGSYAAVPTSGIVGAASSRVSVPVAGLGRLFRTPQVSYASSSALLSDRTRYEYFYRTIPPDDLQASAMVDILLRFEWTYVSIIFSQDTYGQPGIDEFQREAQSMGICTDLQKAIPTSFSSEEYDKLVQELASSQARVVIVFANQETVKELLTRINNSPIRRNFTWIASDAWARSIDLVHKFNDTAAGLFGVAPLTEHVSEFDNYFSQLTINSNTRNHWFPEFYAAYANCTLDLNCNNTRNVTSFSRYQQGNFIPLVIDAVYTFAHALHNFLEENCNATAEGPFLWFRENGTCLGQSRELNGSALLEYLGAVNLTSLTGNSILFDTSGNVEGMYEILNYQATLEPNGELSYNFQSVGTWDSVSSASNSSGNNSSALTLFDVDHLQFGLEEDDRIRTSPVVSGCGRCEPGSYVRLVPTSCCSICEPCVGGNYSNQSLASECSECLVDGRREMWGNNPFVGSNSCVPIPETSIRYSDPWAVPSLVLGSLGLICVAVAAIIFGRFWMTAVVKSSGREHMILLLTGISCSFLLSFFYLAPPSIPICLIQRLGLWFCYSLMFSALTLKVLRVARIFYGLKRNMTYKPRFTEPGYQVAFTLILVAAQMTLIIISLAFIVHPTANRRVRYDHDSEGRLGLPDVIITCTDEHIAIIVISILYESALIIAAAVLGALSFKYPDNFNEAKYISFCTFALLIVWIGLIPTYFATQSQQEYQNAAISIFVILSAYAMLVFLFGPKLFIILFQPEKNTTHFSTHHTADSPDQNISMHTINYRDGEPGPGIVCSVGA